MSTGRPACACSASASCEPSVVHSPPSGSGATAGMVSDEEGTALPRRGHQPRDRTSTRTAPGATKAVSWSRRESDTVDLLQAAAPLLHQIDGRVAQEAGAAAARGVLEHPDRLARDDHLAQLVRQRHDFRDGGAALEAGASALSAAAPVHE